MKRSAGMRWIAAGLAAVAGAGTAVAITATGAGATTPPSNLTGNQVLASGGSLQSADGQYELTFTNGVLKEQIIGGRTLWTAGATSVGAKVLLQPNGVLVDQAANGQVLWSSNATGTGCPSVVLQSDGNLVDYDPATAIWNAGTARHGLSAGDKLMAGWTLMAYGSHVQLAMQSDGNLVLYNAAHKATWSSRTSGNPGAYATLQSTDGNFVVYSAADKALWSTKTGGNPGDKVALQADGGLIVSTSANKVVWSAGTANTVGTGAGYTDGAIHGSTTPCPAPVVTTPTVTAPPVTETQTVTVPTTTVVTVTNPTRTKARKVSVAITVHWFWRGTRTYLRSISLGRLPSHAKVTMKLLPRIRGHHSVVISATGGRPLTNLLRYFESLHYVTGQRLEIEITRPGYVREYGLFTIRSRHLPALARA